MHNQPLYRPVPTPWPWVIVLGVALGTGGAILAALAALQVQLIAGAVAQEVLLQAALLGGGSGATIGVILAVAVWLVRLAIRPG